MNPRKQRQKDRRRARKLAEQAWEAAEDGNPDMALRIIRRAIDANPGNPLLWNDLGLLLVHRDDCEAAAAFQAAISLAPDLPEAYTNLAEIRVRQGLLREAVTLQGEAVRLEGDNRDYHERLETWCRLAGDIAVSETPPAPMTATTSEGRCPMAESLRCEFPLLSARIGGVDWSAVEEELTSRGYRLVPGLLTADECRTLRDYFEDDALFDRTVAMNREQFGCGTYRYFGAPLPRIVEAIRRLVYPHVAPIANRWQRLLREDVLFPMTWEAYRERCAAAGQSTPTPLLLRYEAGGFNALHRDLRGREFFPIQLVIVLSPRASAEEPDGFTGGEFLFCDEPERKKSDRRSIAAGLGDAILFCTRARLVNVGGAYGLKSVRHGLTRVESGTRFALGVPFHEFE
jgi:hypothetical protein